MRELIGVSEGGMGYVVGSPKQKSILFDKIAILKLDQYLNILRSEDSFIFSGPENALADEFEWLEEEGVVFDPGFDEEETLISLKQNNVEYSDFEAIQEKYKEQFQQLKQRFQKKTKFGSIRPEYFQEVMGFLEIQKDLTGFLERIACIRFWQEGYQAVPLSRAGRSNFNGEEDSETQFLLNCIFKNFPVPIKETPWEKVMDFRHDRESTNSKEGIRSLLFEISRNELNTDEIREKIGHHLNSFGRSLAKHKIEYHEGILEVDILTTRETSLQLNSIDFGELAEGQFDLSSRRYGLLPSALFSPGRFITFLVRNRDHI